MRPEYLAWMDKNLIKPVYHLEPGQKFGFEKGNFGYVTVAKIDGVLGYYAMADDKNEPPRTFPKNYTGPVFYE